MQKVIAAVVLAVIAAAAPGAGQSAEGEAATAWQALRAGGHVALLRHASAPGVGDPPGFRLDDCATQRLLSPQGREEARRIGAALREGGVRVDGVWSSRWCRCVETAELLGLGPVTPFPTLDSFFRQGELQERRQTAELRGWLAGQRPAGTLVLVTHQVNITALTGVVPQPGEIIVARPLEGGDVHVVGRIPPP